MASYDLGTAHGKITLDYNGDKAADQASDDIDRLRKKANEGDRDLNKLSKTLKGLGKGLALTALTASLAASAVQAGALVTQILGMVPALASVASLIALLPGAIIAVQVTLGVLKAATAGVGEALKEAFNTESAEKFNKALEKLSPSAKAFAIAVKGVAPELIKVQQGLQEAFFDNNIQELLPRLTAGLDSIRQPLRGLASDLGRVTKSLLGFVVDSDVSWELISSAVLETRKTIIALEGPLMLVLQGIRSVGAVGMQFFPRIRRAIVEVATEFGVWLDSIARSGQLQAWINQGIATLKTLGGIVANVFSIFNSLVQAASVEGGGLLNTILMLTEQLSAFLKSAEGSAAITAFFNSIMAVAAQLAPIFTTLAGALLTALAPAMATIATELGPVLLEVIQALAPAFGPLAGALADLATAISPILPPLATLVSLLAQYLGAALSGIAGAIGPVIELLGGAFAQALTTLAPLVAELAAGALPLAAALGEQLLSAIAPLAPVIIEVAKAFADELAPALPGMVAAAIAATPALVELAKAVTDLLVYGLQLLLPYIPQIVDFFALMAVSGAASTAFVLKLAAALVKLSTGSLKAFVAFLGWLGKLPGIIGGAFQAAWEWVSGIGGSIVDFFANLGTTIGAALSGLGDVISGAFAAVGTFFTNLGNKIIAFVTAIPGFLANLPQLLIDLATTSLNNFATAIGFGLGLIVGIFTKLPQRIADALVSLATFLADAARAGWAALKQWFQSGVDDATTTTTSLLTRVKEALLNLPSQLAEIAVRAWNSLKTAFSNGVTSAIVFVRNLITRVRTVLSQLPGTLAQIARDAWGRLKNAFSTGIREAVDFVSGLPRKVRNALGDLGSLLLSSGRNIINGLKDGISDGINSVLDMVRGLADRVKSAFNSALEIFSPSRVFIESGVNIDEGLIMGLKKKMGQVQSMAERLADSVIAPTIGLPAAIAPVSQTAAYNPFRSAFETSAAAGRTFGPYQLEVDGKVITAFAIDAITGNPKVVRKAATEGARQAQFA